MSILRPHALSLEVAQLVNAGIYSLYRLPLGAVAPFVLAAAGTLYLLTEAGEVAEVRAGSAEQFAQRETIFLSDVESSPAAALNLAVGG